MLQECRGLGKSTALKDVGGYGILLCGQSSGAAFAKFAEMIAMPDSKLNQGGSGIDIRGGQAFSGG
mgnify:CR=1 FL=1